MNHVYMTKYLSAFKNFVPMFLILFSIKKNYQENFITVYHRIPIQTYLFQNYNLHIH